MRRASLPRLLLAAALLATPACYDLGKVNPGARWIDNFSGYPYPTWSLFQPWLCGTFAIPQPPPDGGARDGSIADGGSRDAGRAEAGPDTGDGGGSPGTFCLAGPGDDVTNMNPPDIHGLEWPFDLPGGEDDLGVFMQTSIAMGAQPIDVTGFKDLVFSARLESTSPKQNPVPLTTELRAELGCSRNGLDSVASQAVPIEIDHQWTLFRAPITMFDVKTMSLSQACLAEVDSIRFVVLPGNNEAPSIGGTLSIDNVQLQD